MPAIGVGIGLPFWSGGGVQFNPAMLFATGQQGAWYEPSDFATMFQDVAGSTPVTAVEQPVSVMLDKRLGLVRGPELVAGQTWSSSGVGAVGGVNRVTFMAATAGSGGASAMIVVGKFYEITYTISGIVNGSIGLDVGGGAAVQRAANGTYTERKYASASGTLTASCAGTVTDGVFVINSCKLIDGNHVKAVNAVVSARVNLLTKSEDLTDVVWVKAAAGTTAPVVTASNKIVFPSVPAAAFAVVYQTPSLSASMVNTASVTLRGEVGGEVVWISWTPDGSTYSRTQCTLTTSLQTFTLPFTTSGSGPQYFQLGVDTRDTSQTTRPAQTIYVGTAQVQTGSVATRYQRVNTATDYDTVNFPAYIKYNGTSTLMQTFGNVDFSATDKMTVWAGVRKLNDTAGIVAELSADTNSNPGSMFFASGLNGSFYWFSLARGTAGVTGSQQSGISSGSGVDTAVITITHDIAGSLSTLRRNAVLGTNGTGSKGTGNFGNYPLYVGARGGASAFFSGNIYNLIVRGAASTVGEIAATEMYVNSKTGAY